MSDFLRNLAGRSLGVIESVRPRVPSLFEPCRREGGLQSEGPSFPARPTGDDATIENCSDQDADGVSMAQSLQTQGIRKASRTLGEPHPGNGVARNPSGEAFEPPNQADAPLSVLKPGSGRSAPSLASAAGHLDHATGLGPTLAGQVPTLDSKHQPVKAGSTGAEEGTFSAESPPETGVNGPAYPKWTEHSRTVAPGNRPRLATPNRPPLAMEHAQVSRSGIRPPVPPRSARLRGPDASATTSPDKTSVEVSIGRVEVRAVFPEPPVRRTQSLRSRPSVSLDDYLSGRHRGGR